MEYTATYSPEDNKLRLSAASRLDSETYARVKAAGFKWAPKQEIFVAPMWTPTREDLLLELAGEIEDEDKSLVERAEERAERFEQYSENRAADAERAHDAVSAIADNIPLGQPILVGHHSEKRARKDAEKIENGMRKAVKMWQQSKYWTDRAAGAIRHAKYKERPDVRHRRIKGIEADLRKTQREIEETERMLTNWRHVAGMEDPTVRNRAALAVANTSGYMYFCFPLDKYPRKEGVSTYEGDMGLWSALHDEIIDGAQAAELALPVYERRLPNLQRWVEHYENRIAYERAMLAEDGGTAIDKFPFALGGRVLYQGDWLVILRINKTGESVNSLTCTAPRVVTWSKTWKVEAERVQDYQPPSEADTEKVKAATKLPPLCNYPGEGFLHMTKAEYDKTVPKWSDFPKIATLKPTESYGRHRVKQTRTPGKDFWHASLVYLTDQKRTDPPPPTPPAEPIATPPPVPRNFEPRAVDPAAEKFEALQETLRAGVQVVSAPQLFPTPPELARRMVELAEIEPGMCVLEPSAGTGAIVRAVRDAVDTEVLAYEINHDLCSQLRRSFQSFELQVRCMDFLEATDFIGCYPRVLMNPPFENGSDIKHIEHAIHFLKPGGRLVAICANGPRQQEKLKPLAETWETLPVGTFAGTGVNAALMTYTAPEAKDTLF